MPLLRELTWTDLRDPAPTSSPVGSLSSTGRTCRSTPTPGSPPRSPQALPTVTRSALLAPAASPTARPASTKASPARCRSGTPHCAACSSSSDVRPATWASRLLLRQRPRRQPPDGRPDPSHCATRAATSRGRPCAVPAGDAHAGRTETSLRSPRLAPGGCVRRAAAPSGPANTASRWRELLAARDRAGGERRRGQPDERACSATRPGAASRRRGTLISLGCDAIVDRLRETAGRRALRSDPSRRTALSAWSCAEPPVGAANSPCRAADSAAGSTLHRRPVSGNRGACPATSTERTAVGAQASRAARTATQQRLGHRPHHGGAAAGGHHHVTDPVAHAVATTGPNQPRCDRLVARSRPTRRRPAPRARRPGRRRRRPGRV